MKKQLAWIFGGTSVAALGFAASMSACSSTPAGNDAGMDASNTQDTGMDVNTTNDTGTNDAGSVCDSSTPTLHPTEAGVIFCGYPADGGEGFDCPGQECCLGGEIGKTGTYYPEECAPWNTNCPNPANDAGSIPILCEQSADCTANGQSGAVCCLQGAEAPSIVSGCSYYKSSDGDDVICEQPTSGTCASGELEICSSTSDCPTGETCTPMKWKIYQLGFCM